MKKLLIVMLLCFTVFVIPSHAGLLTGLIKNDLSLLKAEVTSKIDKIITTFETKINAVMQIQNEMKADIKTNAAVVAGINNKVNNTNTSESQGRDKIINNDPQLMKDYIQAIKDGNAEQLKLMWKIIYGLLGVIGTLITLVGTLAGYLHVIISSMLKSKDDDDKREDEQQKILIDSAIKK